MRTSPKSQCPSTPPVTRAFSLVEILVAVTLLSFIVLGLLAAFNQTQRAFRSSMAQTDVLETGRAVSDMLARELQEAAPGRGQILTNGNRLIYSTNFFAEPSGVGIIQALPGTTALRQNWLERLFFVTHQNQDWVGTGYQVVPYFANAGVGTLYRWCRTNAPRQGPLNLSSFFQFAATTRQITNFNRIAEGIVHLRVTTYATNGFVLSNGPLQPACFYVDSLRTNMPYARAWNTVVFDSPVGQAASYFVSNAVPAYVEVELGILEPQVLERYRAIGNATAAANYLSNRVAQVHLFRQRVSIRNVDFTAYQ